ncbi:MAG: hypothetical protein AAF986_08260 [Pseudomonadota bacterium]
MFSRKRTKHREAMMHAIDIAAGRKGNSSYVSAMSRAAGLRVIRLFEEVNGIVFDPFNGLHLSHVTDSARFNELLRKART